MVPIRYGSGPELSSVIVHFKTCPNFEKTSFNCSFVISGSRRYTHNVIPKINEIEKFILSDKNLQKILAKVNSITGIGK